MLLEILPYLKYNGFNTSKMEIDLFAVSSVPDLVVVILLHLLDNAEWCKLNIIPLLKL